LSFDDGNLQDADGGAYPQSGNNNDGGMMDQMNNDNDDLAESIHDSINKEAR